MIDRPFREVHELYRIVYQRAEAQQEAEKARKEKEEEEERKKKKVESKSVRTPQFANQQPSDAINNKSTIPEPSPLELESFEDVIEELI